MQSAEAVERRGAGRLLPHRLGGYELFDHIGRGGMADIYRARREASFGVVRQLVVKEVLPELARSERLANLLAEEAKVASKLEHANVVRIEDLRREDGVLFIAMEYVEGLDLRELMRRASRDKIAMPLELSVFIIIEVLRALDYAHRFRFQDDGGDQRVGVVHRDVSPSNVLLSFDGEVKLCDFGIARSYDPAMADGENTAVIDGMVEGKAGYMSPEQAHGERLDGRADVFAAGILLWELASGKKLYKAEPGETLFDVARRAIVPPLPERGHPREAELRQIVMRALSREREHRYASAADMLRDLTVYAARAGLVTSAVRLRKFLAEGFAEPILTAQHRRELATKALAQGPLAVLEVRPKSPAPETTEPTPTDGRAEKRRKRTPRPRRVEPKPIESAAPTVALTEIAEPTAKKSPAMTWVFVLAALVVLAGIAIALGAR